MEVRSIVEPLRKIIKGKANFFEGVCQEILPDEQVTYISILPLMRYSSHCSADTVCDVCSCSLIRLNVGIKSSK